MAVAVWETLEKFGLLGHVCGNLKTVKVYTDTYCYTLGNCICNGQCYQ